MYVNSRHKCVVYMKMQSAKTNQRKHRHRLYPISLTLALSLCVAIFATDDHVQSSTPQRKSRTNQRRTVVMVERGLSQAELRSDSDE